MKRTTTYAQSRATGKTCQLPASLPRLVTEAVHNGTGRTRQTIAPKYQLKAKLLDALAVTLLMIVTAALGCAVLILSSPKAKADVDDAAYAYAATFGGAVCHVLDIYPNFDGILGIAKSITDDGLSSFQAGEVIQLSVEEICPRHQALLNRFVHVYAPSSGRAA